MDTEHSKASDVPSMGGKARASKLSKEERSKIARQGAGARWKLPRAVNEGPLTIGDAVLDCAVLKDGTRLVSQTKFMEAMDIYYSGYLSTARQQGADGSAEMPLYFPFKKLKPYVDKHIGSMQLQPVKYLTKSGNAANGIRAELIPKICEVWLDARAEPDVLTARQRIIADKAEILIRGFAQVGIVALIDEATGFQVERQQRALQELLQEILSEELRRWVRTFPESYFKELCRLRNVPYRSDMKLPPYFGKLTNDIVYNRLAPNVLRELEDRNPKNEFGRRTVKHFQWLSEDHGHPRLLQHLGGVVALMRVAPTWDAFKKNLDQVFPLLKTGEDMPLLREMEQAGDELT